MKLLCLGKMKDQNLRLACDDFIKRISRFSRIDVVELKDEKILDDPSKVVTLEGKRILSSLKADDFVIVLDKNGKKISSEFFAGLLKKNQELDVVFVIGGALGLSEDVLSRADFVLSFSDMTFTHQMARLFLLEQAYRAHTILRNIPYHK